eukprot:13075075-Heterocapsa_arctica.AAC.1
MSLGQFNESGWAMNVVLPALRSDVFYRNRLFKTTWPHMIALWLAPSWATRRIRHAPFTTSPGLWRTNEGSFHHLHHDALAVLL